MWLVLCGVTLGSSTPVSERRPHRPCCAAQDLIALGPKGRDGSVFLLDRNRRRKRKPDWLQNSVDPDQRAAVPCALPLLLASLGTHLANSKPSTEVLHDSDASLQQP